MKLCLAKHIVFRQFLHDGFHQRQCHFALRVHVRQGLEQLFLRTLMATITQRALCIESALNDAPMAATADTVPSGHTER